MAKRSRAGVIAADLTVRERICCSASAAEPTGQRAGETVTAMVVEMWPWNLLSYRPRHGPNCITGGPAQKKAPGASRGEHSRQSLVAHVIESDVIF